MTDKNFELADDGMPVEYVILQDRYGNPVEVDTRAYSLVTITSTHRMIHLGKMFDVSVYNPTLGIAGNLDLLIRVGAKYPHSRLSATANGSCTLSLYSGPTVSNDGSAAASVNRNLNSSVVSETVVTSGPTVSNVGTLITQSLLSGSGKGSNTVGGQMNGFEEFILEPSGVYLLRLNNISASIIEAQSNILYYEP